MSHNNTGGIPGPFMVDCGVNFGRRRYTSKVVCSELESARVAGVNAVISMSSTPREWAPNRLRARQHPGKVFYTAGVHPLHARTCPDDEDTFRRLLEEHCRDAGGLCVAVGECGLDYDAGTDAAEVALQHRVFTAQVNTARDLEMPLYLHCRGRAAWCDFRDIIDAAGYTCGVIHCFTGTRVDAVWALRVGFHLGITGWLLDDARNADLLDAMTVLPLHRVLLETDSPYLPVVPGKPFSEPADVVLVAARVGILHGIDTLTCLQVTAANARRLFRLPPPHLE